MTQSEASKDWFDGAKDALKSATVLHDAGQYASALFECHLAVEKALKGAYILQHGDIPPKIHRLLDLALQLETTFSEADQEALAELTSIAILSRYGDGEWRKKEASKDMSRKWLETSTVLVLQLTP